MKRKALIGLAVFAVIGVGVVFAARLDDLTFVGNNASFGIPVKAAHKGISGHVVIPANAPTNNHKVSSVAANGFDGCSNITSVTMPDPLTSVGQYAFANCTGLSSVTFGTNRVNVSSYAFSSCQNLTRVTFGGTGGNLSNNSFPGDLATKYKEGGSGTYTRRPGSNEWFKGGSGGGNDIAGAVSGAFVAPSNVPPPPPPRGGPPPRGRVQYCNCCGQPLP